MKILFYSQEQSVEGLSPQAILSWAKKWGVSSFVLRKASLPIEKNGSELPLEDLASALSDLKLLKVPPYILEKKDSSSVLFLPTSSRKSLDLWNFLLKVDEKLKLFRSQYSIKAKEEFSISLLLDDSGFKLLEEACRSQKQIHFSKKEKRVVISFSSVLDGFFCYYALLDLLKALEIAPQKAILGFDLFQVLGKEKALSTFLHASIQYGEFLVSTLELFSKDGLFESQKDFFEVEEFESFLEDEKVHIQELSWAKVTTSGFDISLDSFMYPIAWIYGLVLLAILESCELIIKKDKRDTVAVIKDAYLGKEEKRGIPSFEELKLKRLFQGVLLDQEIFFVQGLYFQRYVRASERKLEKALSLLEKSSEEKKELLEMKAKIADLGYEAKARFFQEVGLSKIDKVIFEIRKKNG